MRKPHPQQSEKPTAVIKTKPFTKLTITTNRKRARQPARWETE
jgi:hypothetical protein